MRRTIYQIVVCVISFVVGSLSVADSPAKKSNEAAANGVPTGGKEHKTVNPRDQTPVQVVREYLELAARGGHLTDKGRDDLERIAGFPQGNAQIVVVTHIISDYRIRDTIVKENSAMVVVEFDGVGVISDEFYSFESRRRKSKINIQLTRTSDNKWKIGTGLAPHMYTETVIEHMERLFRTHNFDTQYKKAIQQIREAAKQEIKN